ncbi:MAG: hypothetical protein GX552_18655 [Chloroflexi bacterium]|jgi:hypothetical protein|nr:hypothetical protein [Chloroflexota bacterium]
MNKDKKFHPSFMIYGLLFGAAISLLIFGVQGLIYGPALGLIIGLMIDTLKKGNQSPKQ